MHLLYIDESGSAEHTNFVLGGAAIYEGAIQQISKQLDDLQTHYFPHEAGLVEFHVRALRARTFGKEATLSRERFLAMLDDIATVIVEAHPHGIALFGTVVHRPSYPDQDCYNLAFEDMCKRFDSFLVGKHKAGHTSKGLLVLDRSSQETEIQRLSVEFKALGTRWGKLYNIVDAPLFADSHNSRLIQLADFVASSLFRRYEFGEARDLDKIKRRFHQADGVFHGLKHMISRREQCQCAACVSRVVNSIAP